MTSLSTLTMIEDPRALSQPALRAALLELAREALRAAARGEAAPRCDVEALDAALRAPRGAFVTLHQGGALRGCIGTFDTSRPLHETVQEMAAAAATRDRRFPPVSAREVETLTLSISVLTPPRPICALEEVEVGRHGLIARQGWRRGVLLPRVAVDRGWDRASFLAATCQKAGLLVEAWRAFGTPGGPTFEVFEAHEVD